MLGLAVVLALVAVAMAAAVAVSLSRDGDDSADDVDASTTSEATERGSEEARVPSEAEGATTMVATTTRPPATVAVPTTAPPATTAPPGSVGAPTTRPSTTVTVSTTAPPPTTAVPTTAVPTTVTVPTAPAPPPDESTARPFPVGTWVAVRVSLPDPAAAQEYLDQNVPGGRLMETDLYPSLTPGFWSVATGPFATADAAVGACVAQGLTSRNACYGAYLSEDPADRSQRAYPD